MTDADVDGAHIRTLVADAAVPRDAGADRGRLRLHRQAAALQAQAGQPGALHREGVRARGDPARRQVRAASRSPTATASAFKLTEARWQRYRRLLKQYEGWACALRAEHGHELVDFLEESQILDEQIATADDLVELLERADAEGESVRRPSCCRADDGELVIRAVERAHRPRAHAPAAARDLFERQRVPPARAASTRSSSSSPARRRSRSGSATQPTTALSFEDAAARRSWSVAAARASSSSASRASAR